MSVQSNGTLLARKKFRLRFALFYSRTMEEIVGDLSFSQASKPHRSLNVMLNNKIVLMYEP